VVNTPPLTMTLSSTSLDVAAGSYGTTKLTTTRSSAVNAAVALSVSGVPAGITVQFSPTAIAAPGAGTSTLTVSVAASKVGGTYPVTVTATGAGVTKTALLAINVLPPPSFSLSLSATSITAAPGGSATVTASTTRTTTFNSGISLKVTGMPTGVTASTGAMSAPGSGSATLGITVGSTAIGGSYTLTVTATGGDCTKTATLTLLVPSMTFSASSTALTLKRGATTTVNLTSAMLGGLSSAVTFAVQGLPTGVSATFTPASLSAPGNGTTVLKLSATSTATIGAAQSVAKATAGTTVRTLNLALSVTK
jgi:hypothetical protein